MQSLTREELESGAAEFDAAVLATPDIDHFCSACDWILPADAALMPPRTPWLFRGEHGFVAAAHGVHREGWSYVQPFEAAWGLACPVVGPDPELAAAEAAELFRAREDEWSLLLLSGLKLHTPLFKALVAFLAPRYGLRLGRVSRRYVASLDGGIEGFLGRRSRNLRRSLQRALRRADRAGVTFEAAHVVDPAAADAAYLRLLAVEARSWKGREGVGIDTGDMNSFYRLMNRRLVARRAQRLFFARHEGRDVAYVLGGVLGDTYRGLQFSYDDDCAAYSLGSLLQYAQIQELCAQGYRLYDLGAEVDYKVRWGEEAMETVLLIASHRR